MSKNLYAAHRQWASRPADERFSKLEDMYAVARGYYEAATIAQDVPLHTLSVEPIEVEVVEGEGESQKSTKIEDLVIKGSTGAQATFTDYSFRQLCSRVSAPSNYLQTLPADLVARNLNNGLQRFAPDVTSNLLFHRNGTRVFRGMNSSHYRRIWNYEVVEFLMALRELDPNWRVPPGRPSGQVGEHVRLATAEDVLDLSGNFGLSVNIGDPIADCGLYQSDKDIFTFMVNQARPVDGGNGEVLNRGFFISGSEVAGVSTHDITIFLYEHVCGNHIVWGAQSVFTKKFRHVGKSLRDLVGAAYQEVKAVADAGTEKEVKMIEAAKACVLTKFAKDTTKSAKDMVIDVVFDNGLFTRKQAAAIWDVAEKYQTVHGAPDTAWSFAAGATRLSQEQANADERHALDTAAGKVLELAVEAAK